MSKYLDSLIKFSLAETRHNKKRTTCRISNIIDVQSDDATCKNILCSECPHYHYNSTPLAKVLKNE